MKIPALAPCSCPRGTLCSNCILAWAVGHKVDVNEAAYTLIVLREDPPADTLFDDLPDGYE